MFHVEHQGQLARLIREGASELDIILDDSQIELFIQYLQELRKWNERINLTAIREEREIVAKHFLDSLYCEKAFRFDEHGSLLDVGSGAGFPGLPLKIANPGIELALLEPSQKKTAFLRHIIGTLHLKGVSTISDRLQNLPERADYVGPFPFVVTRALNLGEILPFVPPVLAKGGKLALSRTKPLRRRDNLYGLRLHEELPYHLPFGFGDRVLCVLTIS